ncbi:MAG: hypothetical protein ACOYN0_15860 [Phycisphaerales bacterium]
MNHWKMRAAVAAMVVSHASAWVWGSVSGLNTYGSAATFNAAIAGAGAPGGGGILFEDFSAIDAGPAGTLAFGSSTLGFVASTLGPGDVFDDLLNPQGALGTNEAGRPLIFELTQLGGTVYALGGNFWLRNQFGAVLGGSIDVQVGRVGGQVDSFALTSSGPTDYFGIVSSTQLSFVIITPTSPMAGVGGTGPFVTADNVTAAGLIPTPATAGVLALSGLVAMRRRR